MFVQVGTTPSLHAKRSSVVFLLVFPCSKVLLVTLYECVDVISLLLLTSGDVETNPGPMSDSQLKLFNEMHGMLVDLNTRSVQIQESQSGILSSINEIKQNQESLRATVADMNLRLVTVESNALNVEQLKAAVVEVRGVANNAQKENRVLQARLDEAEDQSRRDNLIFFGVSDTVSETWAQTEARILSIFQTSLNVQITGDSIVRAHRLGNFTQNKCRPIIVKFASFKLRDQILLARTGLKALRISVSEDFSLATRNARKQLIEFGKANGGVFKLRYNKLHINNKCYAIDQTTKEIYELGPSRLSAAPNAQPTAPQSPSSFARSSNQAPSPI